MWGQESGREKSTSLVYDWGSIRTITHCPGTSDTLAGVPALCLQGLGQGQKPEGGESAQPPETYWVMKENMGSLGEEELVTSIGRGAQQAPFGPW